ncbi:MAG: SH3 domain-containing protein, partial [Anaerolineae bacterium]|nr:SH3 domain-containing protein [Anaerolineae bacterium]
MATLSKGSKRRWLYLTTLLLLVLAGAVSVSAQNAIPIGVGENQTGQITDSSTPVRYSISSAAPLSIQIQVLAISQGLAPTFRVVEPSGVVATNAINGGTQTIVQGTTSLTNPGTYTIEVSSANGATGQFLISVQAGAPLAPPQPLTAGTPINGSVSSQSVRQAFSFSGSEANSLLLAVRSNTPGAGPVVMLRDADTNETLALNSSRLAGVIYRIGTGAANYQVEVTHSGAPQQEGFVVCLATEGNPTDCPGIVSAQAAVGGPPTPIPTVFIVPTALPTITPLPTQAVPPTFAPVVINPTGACQVASARGATINVRSGPGLSFGVIAQLPPTISVAVLGRLPDNSWFQVNINGVLGWVSASVVIIGGNCGGVPVIQPPTLTPTASASVIPPISTTEVSPFTATPSATPTATATNPPAPVATLNFSLPPVYGSTALTSGFVPDPFTV